MAISFQVGFAYVVGSITASLAQLRTMSEEALFLLEVFISSSEASKDFWQMRRFLNQNSVDHNLAARIQRGTALFGCASGDPRLCGVCLHSSAEDHVDQPGEGARIALQATAL